MSTEYENLAGTNLTGYEHGDVIDLYLLLNYREIQEAYVAKNMDASSLCNLAEELIKLASYISEDPHRTLETYNVDYNKPKYTNIR